MVGLILVACGGAAQVNPELSAAPAGDAATTVPVPTTAPTKTPAAPAGAYIAAPALEAAMKRGILSLCKR